LNSRHFFEHELEELRQKIIKMGTLIVESIENTIIAFEKQNIELAEKLLKKDDEIDRLENKIEKICISLIARQHPIAKDLRMVSTALKIITDMERIADHSSDIADITIRMAKNKYYYPTDKIINMANKAKIMVEKTFKSYTTQDIQIAMNVCSSDDEIDELFNTIILDLINLMRTNTKTIEQATDLMFVIKYIERIADHATNISEWVVFNITGKHEHLTKHLHKDTPPDEDAVINDILKTAKKEYEK